MAIKKLDLTQHDEQGHYKVEFKDTEGNVQDLTGATIVCSMKNIESGVLKIDRQSAGINVTDEANGLFQYEWVTGDTDTVGRYQIEFEITPASGGKVTIPNPGQGRAIVEVHAGMDAS